MEVQHVLNLSELSYLDVLLNNVYDNSRRVENKVVLIVKFYIYKTKCLNQWVSVTSCINYVKEYCEIDFYIYSCSQKLPCLNETCCFSWSGILLKFELR